MDQGKDLAAVHPAGEHASVAASALPDAEPLDTFTALRSDSVLPELMGSQPHQSLEP
jgi:hypothetical protein